ncbi:MAG: SPOR domain-containing protein, partial [Burkholderiaceae bacterium]
MGLAFWRRAKNSSEVAPNRSSRRAARAAGDDESNPSRDEAATLKARARRRLIGAAALLIAAAIVVPMILDPEPRPVRDNIAIDIPSEKTPFTPRLSLPPVPAPENTPLAPPSDAPAASVSEPAARKAGDDRKAPPVASAAGSVEEQRARAVLEGKGETAADLPGVVKSGKFVVQAAAPASEAAARDLVERLKKSGLASYI